KSRDEIEQPKPSPKVLDHSIIDTPWIVSLPSNRWALKENQEYRKKGGGKHITETVKEILKSFFHTSDKNKSERYTAKEMLQDLQQREQMEELEAEEIPNFKTIENWISQYSLLHKKEAAKKANAAVSSQKSAK
ncbi:2639_t:CDS:2, partial [Dentiscutata heterogama]